VLVHTVKFFVAVALCLTATLAQAAGFRFIEVPADAGEPALEGRCGIPAPSRRARSMSAKWRRELELPSQG
jgi:hypothetical protein